MSAFLGAHNIMSPLGFSSQANFDALLKGHSEIKKQLFPFSTSEFVCSKINDSLLDAEFSVIADTKKYTFLEKLCILSIADVVKQSAIDLSSNDSLLILSTTKGNMDVLENKYPSLSLDRAYLPKMAAVIGNHFHCKHAPVIVSNACISGLLALIIAKRFIENKTYKNIIVCGTDLVSEFTLSGFRSFNALSDSVCKPFDLNRSGINLGEATASLLLSADPISQLKITAGSSANDANHISGPSREGSGLFQSLTQTFKQAGKEKVDFICAHGTATEYNDEMEAVAFSRAHLNSIPLHSLKAYYGHTLGAAGVLESIISLMSLQENTLIKSKGFETTGTSQTLNIITKTEKTHLNSCLKTASGFGGCNASAIFEKL